MPIVLAFDLGTTFFKACLFDGDGKLLALGRLPTPIDEPHAGWRQIEPACFYEALRQLVRQLREQDGTAFARVEAISFATQTNSALLLDEHDEPVSPIVLWNDRRAEELAADVGALGREPGFRQETGVPAMGPGFAVAKLMWRQRHDAAAWGRARRWRLIGDQLVWWLTGRHVTEAGAAGLTSLLDVHRLQWRDAAVSAAGLASLTFPEPMRAGADLGAVSRKTAEALQLPQGCRVVLGCLDQYAGALGAGNVTPGGVSETTGTVLATVSLAETFDATLGPTVFQGPAWQEGLWWRMCFGSVSAPLFDALRRDEPDEPTFDTLEAEAATVPAGAAGLRLDLARSEQAGTPVFEGYDESRHTRGHRVRAVFEGVARALKAQLDSLDMPQRPEAIYAVGGAAGNALWLQIKANTLGLPIIAMDTPEPTSLGAAILALARLSSQSPAAVAGQVTHVRKTVHPT